MNLRLIQIIALSTLSLVALPAEAQKPPSEIKRQGEVDPTPTAKQYVDEGAALYAKADWAGAHVAFMKAWEIMKHRAIAANLAEVEIRLGLFVQAAERLKYLISTMEGDHDEEFAALEAQMAVCRKNSTSLTVVANEPDAHVRVNSKDMGTVAQAGEMLIEPGIVTVEIRQPGYQVERRELSLERGKAQRLDIRLEPIPKGESRPSAPLAFSPTAQTRRNESGVSSKALVLIAEGTLTVAAGVVGLVYWRKSKDTFDEVDSLRAKLADGSGGCYPGLEEDSNLCRALGDRAAHGDRERNTMTGAFIAGGLLGATTVATYLLWPTEARSTARVTPWSTRHGGGVKITAHF